MKRSIEIELKAYISDKIDDGVIHDDNQDEWHFHLFNEDYYIIGYWNASEWLKAHGIGEFEAADTCVQYENDNFGESTTRYDNSETVVNMLAYIYGEELLSDIGASDIEELKEGVE